MKQDKTNKIKAQRQDEGAFSDYCKVQNQEC